MSHESTPEKSTFQCEYFSHAPRCWIIRGENVMCKSLGRPVLLEILYAIWAWGRCCLTQGANGMYHKLHGFSPTLYSVTPEFSPRARHTGNERFVKPKTSAQNWGAPHPAWGRTLKNCYPGAKLEYRGQRFFFSQATDDAPLG